VHVEDYTMHGDGYEHSRPCGSQSCSHAGPRASYLRPMRSVYFASSSAHVETSQPQFTAIGRFLIYSHMQIVDVKYILLFVAC